LLVLDNLGRALNDPALKDSHFRIAGHTDAAGGDAYNQRLSEERAWTVCSYLTLRHHVAAQRLSAAGYGRSQPIDPADPNAAVNRRVEITNIGQN
jgi:outer membrane protein OmpA-like peptidoglycan-associated protein